MPHPTPKRRATAVVAVLLSSTVLAACSNDEVGASGDAGFVSGKGVITRLPAEDRTPPGEVAGETLEGEPISLADYEGKTVVVNVWGSWCAPCRSEAPDLVEASQELAADGVEFLGINSRDLDRAAAQAFQRRFEVPYPSIYDQKGQTLLAFRGTLSPNAIPSTVVIDEQGRVAASIIGETTKSTLVGLVEDVQAEAG
ncbi:MAG TPA: TlpA disulfide reductase family protein [Nocardioidaceae bacterium]|nr:TlpA disulfide reductase family protein [Nocardioidaceae bacterium]